MRIPTASPACSDMQWRMKLLHEAKQSMSCQCDSHVSLSGVAREPQVAQSDETNTMKGDQIQYERRLKISFREMSRTSLSLSVP